MNYARLEDQAKKFRAGDAQFQEGGYVVIYRNYVQGWISDLNTPPIFKPGAYAVPHDGGQVYIAQGDGDLLGADRWAKDPAWPGPRESWVL
jgi:hypothetical protein